MRAPTILSTALTLAVTALPAMAAPTTENFTITAAGFSDVLGATTAPVDPVALTFSLSFDPALGDQFDYASGIRLLSSPLAINGGLAFDYDSTSDTLTIGGAGLGGIGITAGTNDVLAVIDTPYTGTSTFGGVAYVTANTSGIYESFTGAVQVPEPGTLGLLVGGLATIGLIRRRV